MFGTRIETAARKWAEKNYPNEAVGAVANKRFYPLKNIHPEPENNFRVDTKSVPWSGLEAIIHNHPEGLLRPSRHDMECWRGVEVPMGIFISHKSQHEISHSQIIWYDPDYHKYPYEGRPFINGITDCYSLIRDFYYNEYKIKLGDYPRDEDWFDPNYPEKLNLYADYFSNESFKEINGEPQRGDVILMKMYVGKMMHPENLPINHGAIYLGDDKLLHHLTGRLSSIDSASKWINRYASKIIRRPIE